MVIIKLFKWLVGYCPKCGGYFTYPKRRRMNTAYVEDELNYSRVCKDCFVESEELWAEMWSEYYSGRL